MRALVRERSLDPARQAFTDDEARAYLALAGGNVRIAAAHALRALAAEAAATGVTEVGGIQRNGAEAAAALRRIAADLHASALLD